MANVFRPEYFMCRELQMCSLCYANGKGWVRIVNVAEILTLGIRAYRVKRNRAMRVHLASAHPHIIVK